MLSEEKKFTWNIRLISIIHEIENKIEMPNTSDRHSERKRIDSPLVALSWNP